MTNKIFCFFDVDYPNLEKDDFAIGFMTKEQRNLCEELKTNERLIGALDSTHGTNKCDFKLTTIQFRDQYNQGESHLVRMISIFE